MCGEYGVGSGTEDVGKGITPACAGSTAAFALLVFLLRDHPRVCGEY